MTILSHRLNNISPRINSSMKAYLRIPRQMATTLLIPILSFAQLISVPCEGQESAESPNYSDELPRIPALPAEEAIQRIEVAEGFEIQLVASEPLVQSPVAIEWDASGGMFVCEMRGYSENRDDGISRVRYLQDKNQDGVYDQATVFAEGLLWPTAIFPYKKGLFVADAPNIDYFQDLDGDGVAEKKTTVLTGFSVSNVQGLLNSFRWGLDNRIHVACS
ncbi:MAG: PVC-type heme-binding CxxCH protein, partial [Planctomycetota bacterium]|nr:PVC-type heme-binding CxxCH protein [Planctomycetota bacterium]